MNKLSNIITPIKALCAIFFIFLSSAKAETINTPLRVNHIQEINTGGSYGWHPLSVMNDKYGYLFRILGNGKIGIGTQWPQTHLHVYNGTFRISGGSGEADTNARLEIDTAGSTAHPFLEFRNSNGTQLRALGNGQLVVGTQSPVSDYMLTVNGGIYALDLRIRPDLSNTADFVFEDSYTLMPLPQLKSSIQENKHLPGIPSAKEMVNEGVSVAEMQALLLQKIEELTLYIIEQNEKIEEQKSQIESLKKEISQTHFATQYVK